MELASNNSILFIKLKTGEVLLAEVPDEDVNTPTIHLKNPMELVTFDDTLTGQTGFTFHEWIPKAFIEEDILPIQVADTYLITKPTPALIRFYAKVVKPKVREIKPEDMITDDPTPPEDDTEEMTADDMYKSILANLPKSTIH